MSRMSTRTTLTKRDANTLNADDASMIEETAAKRVKTAPAKEDQEDEFDGADDEFDEDALIKAALEAEAESAASTTNATASQSTESTLPASSPATTALTPSKPAASSTIAASQRSSSTMRQATLFGSQPSSTTTSSATATPTLQPPADPSSDPLWLERQTMSPSWYNILHPEMTKPYFTSLKAFLSSEDAARKTTYPPRELIYSWSRLVRSPAHVRVVVVGQDPYHGPGQACGLSFSVNKGVRIPPSLRNIYKELSTEYPGSFKTPTHGCLDEWAKQGVLMLNACLTVSAGNAGSHHGKGWENLTKTVLKRIADEAAGSGAAKKANKDAVGTSKIASMFAKVKAKADDGNAAEETAHGNKDNDKKKDAGEDGGKAGERDAEQSKGVVFLVWGAPAAKTLAEAGVTEKNPNILILKSAHPSPLSAHRGFLGNGHFKKANEWLKQRYGEEGTIDWSRL